MADLDAFGCDLASGRLDRDGYAFHGKTRAHIHAYVQAHGAVPADRVLDHLCGRRACRSVHHLEAVTQSENLKRRRFMYRWRIKRCPRGHELADTRVVVPDAKGRPSGVVCRACNQEAKEEA